MTLKPGLRDLLWLASGAALLLAGLLVVLHFREDADPAAQIAARAQRLELIDRMRLALVSASESGQGAVVAGAEAEARALADESRAALASVAQTRQELAGLLAGPGEQQALAEFAAPFEALSAIDAELLELAGRNTNTKASALAYGPAAEAVQALTDALARLSSVAAGAPDGPQVAALASAAQLAALRVQVLLPPHVAEADDARMDELEARMREHGQAVQQSLDALRALPGPAGSPELEAAASAWARFRELEAQILALSRENTNVRSLALSADRRRKALLACQQALDALRRVVEEQPVAGVDYGRPPKPR